MPFKGEYPSLAKFTAEEIAKFVGETKECPRCGEEKDILNGFGLRRPFCKKAQQAYVMARPHCRQCDTFESNRRRIEHPQPSKTAAARMNVWKRDYYNPDSVFRKKWLARGKAKYHFKKRLPCEVVGCNKLGERHHQDYDKPLEIRWLCRWHHKELHANGVR